MHNPQPKEKRERLKGAAWNKRRIECFVRDGYRCQYCWDQQAEEQHSLHPHHIKHKSQFGGDELENINTCCWACHYTHGIITRVDKEWLMGKDVYKSGRM